MRRGRRAVAVAVTAAALGGCIQLSVNPDELASIQFDAPSSPSLVIGDSLRDTLGVREPLRARVYAASGKELPDVPVRYTATDSLVRIVGSGLVVSRGNATGTARLFATAGGLQSLSRALAVIRRPDSIAPSGTATRTVSYKRPTAATGVDSTTTVTFVLRAGDQPVASVRVRFELLRRGVVLSPKDTSAFWLASTRGLPAVIDTTDGSGNVTRQLRFRTSATAPGRDTLVVRALPSLGGPPLKGAPAAITVVLQPAP